MAKFSFPIPGRKQHLTESGKENAVPGKRTQRRSNKSKAHVILGAESSLNIDSISKDQAQCSDSRSSAMSVTISESESATDSFNAHSDRWDLESGVFPRGSAANPKFAPKYDDRTDNSSLSRRRIRNFDSSSTLDSYYERQKSPLSVSQQTSASSARDLALRKGLPPVIPLSPLSTSILYQDALSTQSDNQRADNKPHRKKPARLDLSILFSKPPRQSKFQDAETVSQSSKTTTDSKKTWLRTKSKKHHQKDRQDEEDHVVAQISQIFDRGKTSHGANHGERTQRQHYQSSAGDYGRPATMSKLHVSPRTPTNQPNQPFSWKNVRANMGTINSGTSLSSFNSTTSRHTSAEVMGSSDLLKSSVLALSSDSEEESRETERVPSRLQKPRRESCAKNVPSASHSREKQEHHQDLEHRPSQKSSKSQHSSRSRSSRKGAAQITPCLTIPETSSPVPHIHVVPDTHHQASRKASVTSTTSGRSSIQPTPPHSPRDSKQEKGSQKGRMMVVTKQEEALLEALRQKRARMREEIIEEIETQHSPPLPIDRNTSIRSEPSNSTLRPRSKAKKLDDLPIINTQPVDVAEPSPDLSDFLTFGSDDESTPRSSWASPPPNGFKISRTQSQTSNLEKVSPQTPPGAARLSAVGVSSLYRSLELNPKKSSSTVRFMEDGTHLNPHDDFILDDSESGVIWGM